MKDDKARRNDKIFAHDKDLRQTYEWVNENRKLFRRPVHGPIVCDVVTNDVDASNYLEQHVKNTVLKSFVVECREDMNLLYREVREKRNWKININIVNQGTLEPVRRMYSDNKMKTLKERYGIAGYLDELFEAPPAILQALRNTANVHSVLIGGNKTSLNDDLGKFLSQKENGNGKQSFCMFVKEGPKAYKHTATTSRYNTANVSISVDEVRPARMLSPGVPPEQKNRAEREVKVAQEEFERLQPSITTATQNFERFQRDAQEKQAMFNDRKQG
eukprot:scaffold11253_cov215-Chaetoceros_neogracile.AAC.1